MVTADIEGKVDNARMREITPEHTTDITKLLQKLVSKKALIQDGQGRWTSYHLATAIDSVHKQADSGHIGPDLGHIRRDSGHKNEISDHEWDNLVKIAEIARLNRRLSPTKMEGLILDLCRNHWLTRKQLAELLARHNDGLRSRFLTPMVEHGLLCLRFPEKPNCRNFTDDYGSVEVFSKSPSIKILCFFSDQIFNENMRDKIFHKWW